MGKTADISGFHQFLEMGYDHVTGVVYNLDPVGQEALPGVGCAIRHQIFWGEGNGLGTLMTAYRQHALFVLKPDDDKIKLELPPYQVKQIIHDNLQVEGPVHDLRCPQPDGEVFLALSQR